MSGFGDTLSRSFRARPPWVVVEENRLSLISTAPLRYMLEYRSARLEGLAGRMRKLLVAAEGEFDLVNLLRLKESAERLEGNTRRLRAELREILTEERKRAM